MDLNKNRNNSTSIRKEKPFGLFMALILFGGILVSTFASNWDISALSAYGSGPPNYLLGNLSNANLTASQVSASIDKLANYTKTFVEKSNGNSSKMTRILIDDLVKRNIISEKDKQHLLSFNSALSQIKPKSNFTLVSKDLTSRLENSSNPVLVVLKDILKRETCTPIIGINKKVCLPFFLANPANIATNNMTNVTSGLSSKTFDVVISNAGAEFFKMEHCLLIGGALYGGLGMAIALTYC
jgi:hypothetical protein